MRYFIALLALLALAACGGGGGGGSTTSSSNTTSFIGVAIDGYLYKATVFLDLNDNGTFDAGEPTTTTSETGTFTLSATQEQINNYKVVVVAVAGVTIDQDSPTTTVTSGFTMISPAGNHEVISPLTTQVVAKMSTGLSLANAKTAVQDDLGFSSIDVMKNYVAAKATDTNYSKAHNVAASISEVLKSIDTDSSKDTKVSEKLASLITKVNSHIVPNLDNIKLASSPSNALKIATIPPSFKTPVAIKATSYLNAKTVNFGQAKLPFDPYTGIAHAFADFKRNGEYQLFIATVGYEWNKTDTYTKKGIFKFYNKQSDGSYIEDTTLLVDTTGCLHPRKSIVADFNQDGRPDIFVGCTGIDVAPFSGEKSALLLSKTDGTYSKTFLDFDAYAHGSSAGDLNGDGYPDILITDTTVNLQPIVLINNKNGTFIKQTNWVPSNLKWKPIYSAELIDINNDGKLDLVLAGHEWDDGSGNIFAPTIILGNGTGDFSTAQTTVLPTVANEGVTLDIIFDNSNIYLLRTSGGDGTFYQSTVIQKITYPGLVSSVVYNSKRDANKGFAWSPWMVIANTKLVSTSDSFSFSVTP